MRSSVLFPHNYYNIIIIIIIPHFLPNAPLPQPRPSLLESAASLPGSQRQQWRSSRHFSHRIFFDMMDINSGCNSTFPSYTSLNKQTLGFHHWKKNIRLLPANKTGQLSNQNVIKNHATPDLHLLTNLSFLALQLLFSVSGAVKRLKLLGLRKQQKE